MTLFDGKVALVTGGGSGIGMATALAFARSGARVMVADINAIGAADTVRQIEEAEGEAISFQCDVSDESDVERLIAETITRFGRLDFAHNNAGIGAPPGPIHRADRTAFDRVLAINVVGVWLCLKHEARYMLEHGGGAIVNTASL